MSTSKERMETLLAHLKMNPNEFASSLGYKRTDKIYNIIKGRNGISSSVARDIHNAYSRISYEWLVDGEGEMLAPQQPEKEKVKVDLSALLKARHEAESAPQWAKLGEAVKKSRRGMVERIRVAMPEAKDVRPSIIFQHLAETKPTLALWAATGKDDKVVMSKTEYEAITGQIKALKMLNESIIKENEAIRERMEVKGELMIGK